MSTWAMFKLADASWRAATGVYAGMYWLMFGTPDSEELKLAKKNQEMLERMERKVDALWNMQMLTCPIKEPNEQETDSNLSQLIQDNYIHLDNEGDDIHSETDEGKKMDDKNNDMP